MPKFLNCNLLLDVARTHERTQPKMYNKSGKPRGCLSRRSWVLLCPKGIQNPNQEGVSHVIPTHEVYLEYIHPAHPLREGESKMSIAFGHAYLLRHGL